MSKSKKKSRNKGNKGSVDHRKLAEREARLEFGQNQTRFGPLVPQNERQRLLVRYLKERRLIVANGPAGTSKTFVPTSWAAEQLMEERIEKIIITRPMVGCDEDIGFLPGDEAEKFSGWLAPFMDVLEGKIGKGYVKTLMKYEKIVARPLMMMRGLTFRNAVVILDEAQNTTRGQMKMFLTRAGEGSKLVVAGDVEQSDLRPGVPNGLSDLLAIMRGSPSMGVVEFTEDDIVRDQLVYDIIMAYRRAHQNNTLQTDL